MPKQNKNKALSEEWKKELEDFDRKNRYELLLGDSKSIKFIKSLLNKQRVRDREEIALIEAKLLFWRSSLKEYPTKEERIAWADGCISVVDDIQDILSTLKSYKLKKK